MEYINIDLLHTDTSQPRQKFNEEEINNLVASIQETGILQPILIDETNKIIDGERRYRASKIANLDKLPCYIVNTIPNNKIHLVQLIANSNRSDLSSIELAKAIKKIVDENVINKQDIAKMLNKQPSYITRLIAMTSEEWLPLIEQGLIKSPNALESFKSLNENQRQQLLEQAKENNEPIKTKDIRALKANSTENKEIQNNFTKIKVNKSKLKNIIEYINDDEEVEIIISKDLANDIEILSQ